MDIVKKSYEKFFYSMEKKEEFMLLVFSNLIFQIGITFYFMEKTSITLNIFEKFAIYALLIGLLLIIVIIPLYPTIKFIFFTIFSILMGIILSFLKETVNHEFLKRTVIILASFFIVFFLIGLIILLLRIKLSFYFGIILFYILLTIIIFDHLSYLFTSLSSMYIKIIGIIGVIISSLYIVYDTNQILQNNYDGDFVTASLSYYIDIFYFVNFITIGIKYLLYILNIFTAFIGIKRLRTRLLGKSYVFEKHITFKN
jgi:FtsH-binding integral membrane protein